MDEKKGLSSKGDLRPPRRKPTGDPRTGMIESGPLRGRQAVTLGMVKALREDAALLSSDLRRITDKFTRLRLRAIVHTLRMLERVARLPADPATDYRGPTP